jgi:membrane associated rhomboid family serine protease
MIPIRLTRTIKALLIVCFVSFLIQQTGDQFFGTHLLDWFALIPYDFVYQHKYWQIITYTFLHGDVMHLFFNLLMLAFIGGELELIWGRKQFLKYYFFCSIFAGLVYVLIQLIIPKGSGGMDVPMVGASGAIYGLLTAFGILFGERVFLFMLIFPMKAKHFVMILGVIELMTTIYASQRGLAGVVHIAGMIAGFSYLWVRARYILIKKQKQAGFKSGKRLKKKRPGYLKLIVDNDSESDSDEQPKNNPKIWH